MGSTKNTKWEEYTPSSITPITTVGIYKSNKPCDYVSFNGELCPWHGLPGKKYEPQFKVAPILPQTWEDVQTLSTQCTPGPIGPINGDAMTST